METKLTITVLPNGSVKVEGPLDQKLVCYGLLEIARDQIQNYKPSLIQAPTK